MRAGKRHFVDPRMSRQGRARGLAVAGNDIDDARRDAGFERQFAEPQRGERRLFRRLEDHRAAGGERRTDLPYRGTERAVPRDDGADDADRLLERVRKNFAGK
jgi:hypothetical protein